MTSKPDDVTQLNENANKAFNGKDQRDHKRPEDAADVTEVNEAADAEFNDDEKPVELGNTVGGLRGSSD